MSDQTNDPKNPVLSFIGTAFLFIVPAALIVMLGIVGFAFLSGSGVKVEPEEAAKPVAAAAPAPAAPEGDTEVAAAAPETNAPAPAAEEATVAAPAGAEPDPALMAAGKAAYATCAACHGADGTGLKAGPMLMAPSLVGSELLLGDPDTALLIVLKGIAKENMDFMGMMAPLGAGLDDEKLAGVLTYTRNEWGNSAPAVTVEEAAAARAKFAAVDAPAGVKRAELQTIVDAHQ
ncbi:MAG: cytochrome c [Verrucomicrobiales bacterium]|nr:cytochrome c [Verrucomicrobiales bacterium]